MMSVGETASCIFPCLNSPPPPQKALYSHSCAIVTHEICRVGFWVDLGDLGVEKNQGFPFSGALRFKLFKLIGFFVG